VDRFPVVDAARLSALLGDWAIGEGPLYLKLAAALRTAISDGTLVAGTRLPPERRLAGLLTVSRATVVAAYDRLRGEALLESRQGSGTRVAAGVEARCDLDDGRVPGGTATTIFQRLVDGPGSVISLTRALKESVPEVSAAVHEVMTEDLAGLLATDGYHSPGLPDLRAAIADDYTAAGLPTIPEQVLVTVGSQQALNLISDLYLRRDGAGVLVETPSWPGCLDVFRARGARLLTVPLDDEGLDPVTASAVLGRERPTLMYVMPTFQNPTGILMSPRRRRALAELAARHQVPLVEDSAYDAFRLGEDPAPVAAYAPPGADVLTLGSLGKIVWAGLRTGWVRGPVTIIERLARRKVLADLGGPLLDQAIAARLLPRLNDIRAANHATILQRLDLLERLLRSQLPSWRWRRPDGGLSLWIQIPGVDIDAFAQVALRHGVEIVPGTAMDDADRFREFFRFPYGYPPEVLENAVARLARAYADLTRNGPIGTGPVCV